MTRIAIDHDADGAFAVITRPGQAAERVELTHRDAVRLMSEAAQVVLVEEGRRQRLAQPGQRGGSVSDGERPKATIEGYSIVRSDDPPHFLDQIEG